MIREVWVVLKHWGEVFLRRMMLDWFEGWNKTENNSSGNVLNGGKADGEMQYCGLWGLKERWMLIGDLRVGSWDALCEWMKWNEEW